jgi:hypothetical protein
MVNKTSVRTKQRTSNPTLSIEKLRADFNGRVIAPSDPGYDEARTVFTVGSTRRPTVIIREGCKMPRGLVRAKPNELAIAVAAIVLSATVSPDGDRTGPGEHEGSAIDAKRRTAWAETGLTAGVYNRQQMLMVCGPVGDQARLGLGSLGGGKLPRHKYGLTIDGVAGGRDRD